MPATLLQANEFGRLFHGNNTAHGVFVPLGTFDKSGKAIGEYRTDPGPVTDQLILSHLEGRQGLGVVPVYSPNLCQFCAIDIDMHDDTTLKSIRKAIYKEQFPVVPFSSKSGGLHLYMFFIEPQIAGQAIEAMDGIRRVLGLPSDTEIFPKQKTIDKFSTGNWINLPYYNADATTRFAINEYGTAMSLDEALEYCKGKRTLVERVEAFMESLPVNDGPPCLQTLRIVGTTKLRNEYLFSYARYARAKYPDEWETDVLKANNELPEPVTVSELENTVLKSHRKKEYAYKCAQDPLKECCNRRLCTKRMFGVGGNEIPDLDFEDLVQYKSDPPYYEWRVNGQLMRFFTEDDLLKQDVFRRQCTRFLHIVPNRLKESVWVGILNKALQNIEVRELDSGSDISPGSQFFTYLSEFLTKRAMAATRSQILMGRVFFDPEMDAYLFRPKDFLTYVQNVKQFKTFTAVEIRVRLTDLHAEPTRYYIDNRNKALRLWKIPKTALGEQEDASGVEALDFLEDLPEDF